MSSLSMVEAKLPAGFRFHPRDDELICDYLMKWVSTGGGGGGSAAGHRRPPLLIEVDLNKCEPWDIPENACVGGKDWYFYTQRDRKYATGLRTNRATISGYWKATGKDREVLRKGTLVGMRKTLVFYEGRAPKGRKTSWIMYEFRLEGPLAPPKFISPVMVDWVLCKVFNKNRSEVCAREELGSNLVEPYIDEQVSCFSIFTPNPNFSNLIHMDQDLSMSTFPHQLGDKNLVTDVLKFVYARDTSLGEGSAESYLSEVGLQQPPMWNYY